VAGRKSMPTMFSLADANPLIAKPLLIVPGVAVSKVNKTFEVVTP